MSVPSTTLAPSGYQTPERSDTGATVVGAKTSAMTALSEMSVTPTYAQVRQLEAALLSMPQIEPRYEHYVTGREYARVMHLNAGEVITGKRHRRASINIIAAGSFRSTGPDGAMRDMHAPYVFVSPPGMKKLIVALTDGTWVTVHASRMQDMSDLEFIESKVIEPEPPFSEVAP